MDGKLYCDALPMGSFEAAQDWSLWPPSAAAGLFTCDRAVYKVGKVSARISKDAIGDKCILHTYCPMKGGKTYRISFWFKTADVLPDSANMKLALNFNLKDGGNNSAGRKVIPFPAGGAPDWKRFSTVVTAAPNTDRVQFCFDAKGISGTVWLDGVTVVEEKQKHESISVRKAQAPPVIDGKDGDDVWRNAAVMSDFVAAVYETPLAGEQTEVKVSYDDRNLYVLFKAHEENMRALTATASERDGPVWRDDCVELFVGPDTETIFQFLANVNGTLCDLCIKADDTSRTGYRADKTWNSTAVVRTGRHADYWLAEFSIPWTDLRVMPSEKKSLVINFAREDKGSGENSSWSGLVGRFCQPSRFSRLRFAGKAAVLSRSLSVPPGNPFTVERVGPLFEELLTDTRGHYPAIFWAPEIHRCDSPTAISEKYKTDAEWEREVIEPQCRREAAAGMCGSYEMPAIGHDKALAHYKKYGVKRRAASEPSWEMALKNGAEVINSSYVAAGDGKPMCSLVDPIYVDYVVKDLRRMTAKYSGLPYVARIDGRDEPAIFEIFGKKADMGPKMRAWDEEVRTEYGFGRYGIPAPNDPEYWQRPEDHPFQAIAFARWMSDKYIATKKQMYAAVRDAQRDAQDKIPYLPCDIWFMRGFPVYDFGLLGRCGDLMQCDPYASSAEEEREGRGVYNHGFGTKLMADLGEKPVSAIVQAFPYVGYSPGPEDLREWVSQSLKMGAQWIEYLANSMQNTSVRWDHPQLYEEIFRLSKIVTSMNRINVPDDPDTAILVSLDSEASVATSALFGSPARGDHIYGAYYVLGEQIGSWFRFVSDRKLERGEADLSEYKIVYLPFGKYMTPASAAVIVRYVENGGTLVITDPEAFSYNRDGSSLAAFRRQLCGVELPGQKSDQKSIIIDRFKGLKNKTCQIAKKISIYDHIHVAHAIKIVDREVKIIGRFADGKEAILENRLGKGTVIYFAANPFAPDLVFIDSTIKEFFREAQKSVGAKTDRPIWRFMLPAPKQ